MADETRPLLAYLGPDSEVVFLSSMLESSGIECSIDLPTRGEHGIRQARLFVSQADAEAAAPIIAEFREHGVKSRA